MSYDVSFEVAGPIALFNRPDAGSTPISYPVPPWSALKGMCEAVARIKHAYICPTRVEVCAPVRYDRYTTNYGGPYRNSKQLANDNNYQLKAIVLVDVCYKVHGVTRQYDSSPLGTNVSHALQDAFMRRLANGQSLYTPCLGWKEFAPSYFGPLRADTHARADINLVIPSLLHSVFDSPKRGGRAPFFHQDVEVREGILVYPERFHAH